MLAATLLAAGSAAADQGKDWEEVVTALHTKAWDAYAKGLFPDALAAFQRSLEISRTIEAPRARVAEAAAWHGIGSTLFKSGRLEEAQKALERGLAASEKVGSEPGLTRALLTNLGTVYLRQSELAKAERMYQNAIALTKQLGDPDDASRLTASLGTIRFANGLQKFLALRAAGSHREAFTVLRNLTAEHNVPVSISPVTGLIGVREADLPPEYKSAVAKFERHMAAGELWEAIQTLPRNASMRIGAKTFSLSSRFDQVGTTGGVEEALEFILARAGGPPTVSPQRR